MENINYFTEEELEALSKYETMFFNVVYNSFKRGTTEKQNNEIASIYENRTGDNITKSWGCSRCVYNLWLNVGKLYFNSKKHYETEKNKDKFLQELKESEPTSINNNETINKSQDGKTEKKRARKTKAPQNS